MITSNNISAIDLFCGVGGLTHGLIKGGVSVAAGIDVDRNCQYAYENNNNSKFIEMDIRNVTGDFLNTIFQNNSIRLLAGCAPCQPFSTYSQKIKHSRKDDMWNLAGEFGRLINETNPDIVTMENVPQLLKHPIFTDFLEVLNDYHVSYKIVDCTHYGIPQTRKRLVLLASKFGKIELIEPTNLVKPKTVRDAIFNLPSITAGETYYKDKIHKASKLNELNMKRIKASKQNGTWRDWANELVADCHKKNSGKTYPGVYGRMDWDLPSPTITTQCFGFGNGRFGHPEQDRAISLREAAILQTFPDNYKFLQDGNLPKTAVLGRLIGNAVPVKLGEVIAESIVKHVGLFRQASQHAAYQSAADLCAN